MRQSRSREPLAPDWSAAAIEHIREGVLLLDAAGRVLRANPAAAAALRVEVAALCRTPIARWLVEVTEESVVRELDRARALGRCRGSVRAFQGEETRSFRYRLVPAPDPAGAIIVLIRDAADRAAAGASEKERWRRMERARRESALAQANREMEALNALASAVNQSLELRTVLEIALDKALEVARTDAGWVRLIAEDEPEMLELVAYRGLAGGYAAATARVPLRESFGGKAILTGKPLVLYSLPPESRMSRFLQGEDAIRCVANIPLRSRDHVIGVLGIGSRRIQQISERLVRFLTAIGVQVGLAIENARLYEQVRRRASLDPLTQIYNRQCFFELLEREIDRRQRTGTDLAVLMVDVDHFKQINDTYGHMAGDETLRRIAEILTRNLRPHDFVGRFGGDEFVLTLTGLEKDDDAPIDAIVRRLRDEVEAASARGEFVCPVSISIGVAARCATGQDFLQLSDMAMYRDKKRRRGEATDEQQAARSTSLG